MVPQDLHVIGATTDGKLWHTIRFENPQAGLSWQPFGDVKVQTGDVGAFVDVDCARELVEISDPQGILHVVGVTSDGRLWYTARDPASKGWKQFRDGELSAGGPGPFLRAAITAAPQGGGVEVVVAGVTAGDGHVWHTTRDGTAWTLFTDPEARRDVGTFTRVGVADIQSGLHICGVTGDGRLWHTLRIGSPEADTRAVFGDVKAATHAPPAVGPFQAVACS
jgi:hypothetical protein